MRGRALVVTTGLGLAAARGALAQPPPARAAEPASVVEVQLASPAGCDAQGLAEAELDRLLGAARREGQPLRAQGRIEALSESQFRLELTLDRAGATSTRELEAKSCQTLAEVAALLIALSHDPDAVERARALEAARPAPRVDPPAPAPPLQVAAEPAPSPEPTAPLAPLPPLSLPRLGFVAHAGFVGGIGDLPGPHPGVAAGLGLRLDEYRVELGLEFGGASQSFLSDRPQTGATFQRFLGLARFCRDLYPLFDRPYPRPEWAVDLAACAGLELGSMSGEGFGVAEPVRGEALWAAPRVDARLGVGLLGPLGLLVDVGVAFPLDPRRFVITGGDGDVLVVHTPAPAAGRLGLLLEVNL